jgi:ABC-type branched-subunit amino acid transport system permease subunit
MYFNLENMKLDIPNRKIEAGRVSGKVSMKELLAVGIISIVVIILMPNGIVAKYLDSKK